MDSGPIEIQRVKRSTVFVPVVGMRPLIVHAWSQKAKQIMLDAQQGKKKIKSIKDPSADFESSMYRMGDRHGFPALGFKSAIVGGARFYDKSISMAALRRLLYVAGEGPDELIPLDTPGPEPREDVVRVGMGQADLRYRAMYPQGWKAILPVTFVPTSISLDSVVALIDAGGQGDGVGEWRPERGGTYGTFKIDYSREIEEEKIT